MYFLRASSIILAFLSWKVEAPPGTSFFEDDAAGACITWRKHSIIYDHKNIHYADTKQHVPDLLRISVKEMDQMDLVLQGHMEPIPLEYLLWLDQHPRS